MDTTFLNPGADATFLKPWRGHGHDFFFENRGVDVDTEFFENRGVDMDVDTEIFEIVAWTWTWTRSFSKIVAWTWTWTRRETGVHLTLVVYL